MIQLDGVSKNYEAVRLPHGGQGQAVRAVRGVSLEIADGEFVAVMGPSGCGKSTLLHLVGGLDTPTEGEVWVDGLPIHRMDERALSLFRRRSVGIVFQFFNLLPQLSTLENVGLPLRMAGISAAGAERRAGTLLEEVGLKDKGHRLPLELSGGEQQRVALARALVHQPRLVLADEPTGNLDSAASRLVLDVLRNLQRARKATLLLVTHSPEVAQAAHRTLRMQDGQVIEESEESV